MSQPAGERPPTVRDRVEAIVSGTLTSEALVKAHLEIIDANDGSIGAWACLDRDFALAQARERDAARRYGLPVGALHGIPVGIKDIFDTSELPTGRGSAIYADRRPEANSAVVEKLIEAGAVVMGKTVTTELAWMQPAATRNPHDPDRTPGGSSSGSAAAVAAGQVPLAIGSQTGGSTIRPASFCGIYGFKPSEGIISRRGVYRTSQTLDQVGIFAADPGDLALLADVLAGYDAADPASYLAPRPRMLEGYLSDVPVEPVFAWIDLPYADRYSDAVTAGCDELIEALGDRVERIPTPRSFAALIECHKVIYDYEIYRCLADEREHHLDRLGPVTQSGLERAATRTEAQYREALEVRESALTWFRRFFFDYDAILTPSALGEAPPVGEGTGDPTCCLIWTLCGLPCVSLPLLVGENGMPVGVQLVGAGNADHRLFRTTRWLLEQLQGTSDG